MGGERSTVRGQCFDKTDNQNCLVHLQLVGKKKEKEKEKKNPLQSLYYLVTTNQ